MSRILYGSSWGIVGTGAGRVLNLLAMLLAARILGAEAFGALGFLQSTLGLFALLAGGALGATATRHIAAHRRQDPKSTGEIITLIIVFASISSLLFSIVLVSWALLAAEGIFAWADLTVPLVLCGPLLVVGVLRGVSESVLAGFERFSWIALSRMVEGVSALLLIPLGASLSGISGGILGQLGSSLLALLVAGTRVCREVSASSDVRWNLREAWKHWRILRDFSAPSLLAGSVATPVLWWAMLLLGRSEQGHFQLGLYNAAYQWYSPAVFVPMAISTASLPILTLEWSEGRFAAFRVTLLRTLTISVLVAAALSAPLVLGAHFIERIYGNEFRGIASVLSVLLLAAPLHVASVIGTAALQTLNRAWILSLTHLAWGFILLTAFLGIGENRDAVGLATSFALAYLALALSKILIATLYLRQREPT